MSDVIRTAIIGYGTWAERHHAPMLKALPQFELVAVVEPDADRREKARLDGGPEFAWMSAPDELGAEWEYDLAVICTPPSTHCDLAMQLLAMGKHVLVEKPMAMTRPECVSMMVEAERVGKALAVYHQRRFDGEFVAAHEAVKHLGRLGLVEIQGHGWSDAASEYGETPWRAETPDCGGLLYDMGSHRIDQALQLAGMTPKRVFAHVDAHVTEANDHYDVMITGEADDPLARVGGSSCARLGSSNNIYAWGKQGAYRDGRFVVTMGVAGELLPPPADNQPQLLYENVAAHINDGAELIVTTEQAATVVAVCEAGLRSAKIGAAVDL